MSVLYIILIGLGLSIDAFTVSVANGILIKEIHFRHAFRIAFSFGLFQAFMPIIGYATGTTFAHTIEAFDHWVVFGLLAFIGGKMIWESGVLGKKPQGCSEDGACLNCLYFPTLLLLSLSTSIDALAVGLSFSLLGVSIVVPVVIIGVITFAVCIAGVYLGDLVGHLFENKLEPIGGLVLIGLGTKILLEHLLSG